MIQDPEARTEGGEGRRAISSSELFKLAIQQVTKVPTSIPSSSTSSFIPSSSASISIPSSSAIPSSSTSTLIPSSPLSASIPSSIPSSSTSISSASSSTIPSSSTSTLIPSSPLLASIPFSSASTFTSTPTSASTSFKTPCAHLSLTDFPSSNFPSFKRVPGTRFIVDGFRHAGPWSVAYFLSHFHADHYSGITPTWNKGIIFCSQITARLLLEYMRIPSPFVCPLAMGETVCIDSCLVTLVEANHCPGAVQMLFQVPNIERCLYTPYGNTDDVMKCADPVASQNGDMASHNSNHSYARFVHTGDMRYSTHMDADSNLCDFIGADAVFLDTTYCNPKFTFPTQTESIDYITTTIYTLMKDASGQIESSNSADQGSELAVKVEGLREGLVLDPCASPQMSNVEVFQLDSQVDNMIEGEASVDVEGHHCKDEVEDEGYVGTEELYSGNSISAIDLRQNFRDRTLFLISTYIVGKEKILLSVAKQCNCKIYVDKKKFSILNCLELEDLEVFDTNPSSTNVHVVPWNFLGEIWPFFRPNFRNMENILKSLNCHRVVGFVPTGWTYETRKKGFSVRRKGPLEIHLVPYSEHSNYDELRRYVAFLRPREIIPTVGLESGGMDGKGVAAMRKHFRNLVDETANKRRFLKRFCRKPNERCEDIQVDDAKTLETSAKAIFTGPNDVSADIDPLIQRGTKRKHSNSHLAEPLKTVFGRKAKKRVSDAYEITDSVLNTVRNENMTACNTKRSLSSSHNELGNREAYCGKVSGFMNEKEQLRSILPTEVCDEELCDLLSRANRDLNLAVMLYFEGPGKVDAKHKGIHKETSFLLSVTASSTQQNPSRDSLTDTKQVKKSELVGTRKRALKSPVSMQNKKDTRSQSSILNFFKKNDRNTCTPDSKTGDNTTEFGKPAGKTMEALDSYCKEDSLIAPETKEDVAHGSSFLDMPTNKESHRIGKNNTEENKKEVKMFSVAIPISEYKPIEHACWKKGEPAPYIHLARTFELVELESGRLKTSDILCNMFRSLLALSPEAVLSATYLTTNRIALDYENVDLNVGGSMVSAAITDVTGTQRTKIKEMYNTMGDLGDVAQTCRQTQSLLVAPQILTIKQVYSTLLRISKEVGNGSSSRRKSLIVSLLRACREKEMKYIVRTLVQNMRIGAMMRSVLPALAQAVVLNSCLPDGKFDQLKEELQIASTSILDAYNMMPNLNTLVSNLLKDGIKTVVNNVTAYPGIPMKPMLAKIAKGVVYLFKHFQGKAFTCEYKYDGQRAQVHLIRDGSIKIFSRNCEDTTLRFPDVVEIVQKALKPGIQDLIFDAEIVAVDRARGNKLMAFQHLSTRERGGIGAIVRTERIKVDVSVFVFDLMYMNGELLAKMSLQDRRKRMHECFQDSEDCFGFANQITIEAGNSDPGNTKEIARVNEFLDKAISSSCEGIMVKGLEEDSNYAPSKRSESWLKVKKDYIEGLHDTLDLVPIGAWFGNGRKAGWYSPFLLACYDPDHDVFQSVCRVMSGFTDAFYKEMKEFFSGERLLPRKPTYYHTLEEPEVWFPPELVWEIRGADLTVSPVHQAAVGLVHSSRGISLRFPRFISQRPDKSPENANTSSDIADLFSQQNLKFNV